MSVAKAVVMFWGIDQSEFAISGVLEWIRVVNDNFRGANNRQILSQVIGKGIDKRLKAHALAKTVRIHAATPQGLNPYLGLRFQVAPCPESQRGDFYRKREIKAREMLSGGVLAKREDFVREKGECKGWGLGAVVGVEDWLL